MKKIKLNETQLTDIIKQVMTEQSYRGGIIKEGDVPCDIWCKRKVAMRGSRGDVVKMIQHLLARGCGDYGPYNPKKSGGGMNIGCIENWTNCDGKFEKETKKAVEEFQEDANTYIKSGLRVDGKVGYNTLNALCSVCYGTASPTDSAENILCNKQCDCDDQEDVIIDIDDIRDVIEVIDGDPDLNDWYIGDDAGDHFNNCNRIKACLYYASRKDGERWHYFINCMAGKFPDWT